MIANSRYLLLTLGFLLATTVLSAQIDTVTLKKFVPDFHRQLFHDEVKAGQKNLFKNDGKDDNKLTISQNDEVNYLASYALKWRVNWILYKLEKDSAVGVQKKIFYIRHTATLLSAFLKGWQTGAIDPVNLPAVIQAYDDCLQLDLKGESIENYFDGLSYEVGTYVLKSNAFENDQGIKPVNPGLAQAKNLLVKKYCELHPDQIFYILKENPDVPFADSLIKTIARKYPDQLYNYAAANNKLANIIATIDDPFIRAVSRMARSKSGRLYFPFLDNIVNGKTAFAVIDSVREDSIAYYKLLVKTRMDYVARAINKDTAFGYKDLVDMIEKKASDVFVNTINGLHDLSDLSVRFKIIQSLNAQELYYLAVSTDGVIYTSSFVKGVYPLMLSRINQRGDSLLLSLKFDRYRKFIKMCAGYNTLSNFLGTFPSADDANTLMRAFVSGLEKSDSLEDGVDVADSYASIAETMKPVANEMLNNIRINYERNAAQGNKRGTVMYDLLYKLFLSADTSNKIDLSKEFGIPPVYEVPFKTLTNDSGRVVLQLFIYGDKDGIGVFPGLIKMFSNANWKIDESNKQWVVINSAKGRPVSLYMNRPLPEETDEDAKAQEALCDYLRKNKLNPVVTINRGHSYNAPYTIQQMFASSKIVFMGSCGGYRMIHDILEKAPDAHIIGTRQIADAPVNNPFLKLIMEKLRSGDDIDWIPFWKELDGMITNKIFEDYVPPYKNLGAIFIKAYKKAMETGNNKYQ